MIENQSISKKERMDFQTDCDMLSELPLSIIHIILSLVPIRDAVRTSILSRQWRYTWASLPYLVFEDECASSDSKIIRKFEKRVESSINRALFLHKGPIHLFKISVFFSMRSPDIDEWIRCLSRNDIKEFILDMGLFSVHDSVRVHSSIYSCEKLTKLDLRNCELDPPPSTFRGFLFLRCLFLHNVCMSSNEIEHLVANSPYLERLNIIRVFEKGSELRISSPSLKCLNISGDDIELCVSAPSLTEMSIGLNENFTVAHQQQENSICNYANFMGGFANLVLLSAFGYFTKYLIMSFQSCHHTLVFHQLKDIVLHHVDIEDINAISAVARLLVGAPNLETLRIQTDLVTNGDDVYEAQRLSSRDFGCEPGCTFEKLRIVNMITSYGEPLVMDFLRFLLKSSPVLEMMSISTLILRLRRVTEEEKQNVIADFLGFGRASPNAKLFFQIHPLHH